jgi:hypothetical protein
MKTSNEWLKYYQENQRELTEIPWELGPELTDEEKRAVTHSIQEFQLGESSEGRHFIQDAREYCARTGDRYYLPAARLFIAEEARHALDLGRFLQLNGLPVVQTTLGDRVFRHLRNLFPGLELSIAVLITGELIAKVYYAALRKATGSAILRTLCEQILRDEVSHVAFQSEQLARLRAERWRVGYGITLLLQRALFYAAVVFVGFSHRAVMRRAGMTSRDWWRACWREFGAAFSEPLRKAAQLEAHLADSYGVHRSRRCSRSALAPEANA